MKQIKAITFMLLGVFIMSSIIVGCNNANKDTEKADTHQESQSNKAGKEGEDKRITLNLWHSNATEVDLDSKIVKEVADQLGVDFTYETLPESDNKKEYINLKIASGETPDLLRDFTFADYFSYARQDVYAELPKETIVKYAPKLVEWFEGHAGEEAWNYYDVDGKNYSLPSVWTLGKDGTAIGLRKDWLTELGINKMPDTLEEFENVLKKVKEEKQVSMLTASGISGLDFVFGAFDIYPNIFTVRDGKVIRGEVMPKAKEALTILNRWYSEGYIDQEFFVNKEENMKEKWVNGKAGALTHAWWVFVPKGVFFSDGAYSDNLVELDPKAEIEIIPYPAGPDGYRGATQWGIIYSSGLQFGKHLEKQPEKIAKYLEFFNLLMDKDFIAKAFKGDEGITYEVTDEGIKWIAPYDEEDKQKEYGLNNQFTQCFQNYEAQLPIIVSKNDEPLINDIYSRLTQPGEYDILKPIDKPIYNEKKDAIENLTEQNIIRFITGERSLDEFDKYVEEWKAAGGEEILKEAQQKYDELFK